MITTPAHRAARACVRVLALACLALAFTSAAFAQASFPSSITWHKTLYIATNGTDTYDTNWGTSSTPFASLRRALHMAETPLANGQNVRIVFKNGTYTGTLGGIGVIKKGNSNTILAIEGESTGGVTIDGAAYTASPGYIRDTSTALKNLIVRKLVLKNFSTPPLLIGDLLTIHDFSNILVEDCQFVNNNQEGAIIRHGARDVTIRRVKFNGNAKAGAELAIKDALIEDCQFNNNWNGSLSSQWGSGGLSLVAERATFRRCQFNGNGESGMRQDHVAENLLFDACQFNDNTRAGIHLETAWGPNTFQDSEIRGNDGWIKSEPEKRAAVVLATVNDTTFKRCDFIDNDGYALNVVLKSRPVTTTGCDSVCALGAGEMDVAFGQGLTNRKSMNTAPYVLNTRLLGCTLVGRYGTDALIGKRCGDGDHQSYDEWYQFEYTGAGNTFWNRGGQANMFEIGTVFSCSSRQFTDFAGWKAATGTENAGTHDGVSYAASKWAAPVSQLVPVAVTSFTSQQTGNEASNLYDDDVSDNTGARWSASGSTYPQSVVLDLGSTRSIGRFDVYPYANRGYTYTIATSNSPSSGFTQVVNRSSGGGAEVFTHNVSASGRYVRLTVTGGSSGWASICELDIFGQ